MAAPRLVGVTFVDIASPVSAFQNLNETSGALQHFLTPAMEYKP
jgi:hypothetical protein